MLCKLLDTASWCTKMPEYRAILRSGPGSVIGSAPSETEGRLAVEHVRLDVFSHIDSSAVSGIQHDLFAHEFDLSHDLLCQAGMFRLDRSGLKSCARVLVRESVKHRGHRLVYIPAEGAQLAHCLVQLPRQTLESYVDPCICARQNRLEEALQEAPENAFRPRFSAHRTKSSRPLSGVAAGRSSFPT